MRIGLNAISLVPGKIGGMETYLRNLVATLQRLDTDNRYVLMADPRHAGAIPLTAENFSVRTFSYAKPSPGWFARGVVRNLTGRDILRTAVDGMAVDVIHHPFTVLTPPGTRIPSVLTFWDMQHEFFPEFFSPLDLRRRRMLYRNSAEEATRIIVSATFTKECLVERYGIDPAKITVIFTGIGEGFRAMDDGRLLEGAREKHGFRRPFLYYPAATWPHKNHRRLLSAFRLLTDRGLFDGDLVLSGIAMQSHGEILAEIGRLGLEERVRVLGYLPSEELPLLYNLATALVFPSLFEGFGIPLVEAMACGCPIICADAASLPEVAGDAGALFDPRSVEDMAETIGRTIADPERLEELRRRGLQRARLFDWETTARQTLRVYGEAAGSR